MEENDVSVHLRWLVGVHIEQCGDSLDGYWFKATGEPNANDASRPKVVVTCVSEGVASDRSSKIILNCEELVCRCSKGGGRLHTGARAEVEQTTMCQLVFVRL